jgi:hypothetical protein
LQKLSSLAADAIAKGESIFDNEVQSEITTQNLLSQVENQNIKIKELESQLQISQLSTQQIPSIPKISFMSFNFGDIALFMPAR